MACAGAHALCTLVANSSLREVSAATRAARASLEDKWKRNQRIPNCRKSLSNAPQHSGRPMARGLHSCAAGAPGTQRSPLPREGQCLLAGTTLLQSCGTDRKRKSLSGQGFLRLAPRPQAQSGRGLRAISVLHVPAVCVGRAALWSV